MAHEPVSWLRHARDDLVPMVPTHITLSRCVVLIAGAIDEGRMRGLEAQHALLIHVMRILEFACCNEGHDMGPAWPLCGLPDPARPPEPGFAPIERATLAAYHRDQAGLRTAMAATATRGVAHHVRTSGGGGDAGGGPAHDIAALGKGAAAKAKAKAAAKAAAAAAGKGRGAGKGAGGANGAADGG